MLGVSSVVRETRTYLIDGLQYCRWSRRIFEQMREGGVDAMHATVSYHGNFRDAVRDLCRWNRLFEMNSDLIAPGRSSFDVERAKKSNRTAIFLGLQNPSPLEDDIDLVEVLYTLGIRFMQITYNNQSLLASGCYESSDPGLTRMGREVVDEMNRVGMVVDLSHCGRKSALEAARYSKRPVAVTHANPRRWKDAERNVSDDLMEVLSDTGGMIGFSTYPLHLAEGSECKAESFAEMIARCAETFGIDILGIGSDLCQDQPGSVLRWMREGRWKRTRTEESGNDRAEFPPQPAWFNDNTDFANIAEALAGVGFDNLEINKIMGGNWMRFFESSFGASN